MSELEFPTAITASKYHSANDLVAISCRDNVIQVVDIETRKVIRELRGSAATISDFVSLMHYHYSSKLTIGYSASQMTADG